MDWGAVLTAFGLLQFLIEAAVMVLVGGAIGIGVGARLNPIDALRYEQDGLTTCPFRSIVCLA